jgi:hypothetical protein
MGVLNRCAWPPTPSNPPPAPGDEKSDVPQRDIAGMAQESSDALSARSILAPAARVIVVHVDELPLLKRLVAHAASVLLCVQEQVEQLLGARS